MHSAVEPSLTPDEIDDLLYFTRVNDIQDLARTISELAQKYNCSQRAVILAGIDPATNNTLLHYCAANGFADLLQSLLSLLGVQFAEDGAASRLEQATPIVDKQNEQGNTALHWAAYNGQLEVLRLLLTVGADMWIKNSAGQFAMYEAERDGNTHIVEYLIAQHLRDPSKKDVDSMADKLPSVRDISMQDEEAGAASGVERTNGSEQIHGSADVSMDDAGATG